MDGIIPFQPRQYLLGKQRLIMAPLLGRTPPQPFQRLVVGIGKLVIGILLFQEKGSSVEQTEIEILIVNEDFGPHPKYTILSDHLKLKPGTLAAKRTGPGQVASTTLFFYFMVAFYAARIRNKIPEELVQMTVYRLAQEIL